jgi:diguanylate cyclase (GGDEF)-like protein
MHSPRSAYAHLRTYLLGHPLVIILATVIPTVGMLAVFASILVQERQALFGHAVETADNLSLVVEREVTRTFQLLDLSLQAVADSALDPVVRAMPPAYRQSVLFDRATTAGNVLGSILFIDTDGNIVDASNTHNARNVNFRDRDWFTVHQARDDVGTFVSAPYASRLRNGARSIALSRRVNHPDGSFAGVAIAAIKLEYFNSLLEGVNVGARGAVTLLHRDGTILTYNPGDGALIGTNVRKTVNVARYLATGERAFIGASAIDGEHRLFVFRTFKEVPMMMSVGASEAAIYASWNRQVRYVIVLFILLAIALITLSIALAAEFRIRLATEAELRELSRTDSLTGLANRRTLDERIATEWARTLRAKAALSVLFIDIDRFKAYNDTYGHQQGDAVLAAVAHAIDACTSRPTDLAARFGGEEFIVLLPETQAAGANHVAEGIHRAVALLDIAHRGSEFRKVTISVGIATSMGAAGTVAGLLEQADQALYAAKTAGRNRTMNAD